MNLADVKKSISQGIEQDNSLPVHVLAFSYFISPWLHSVLDLRSDENTIAYQRAACLGYMTASGPGGEIADDFISEIEVLSGRKFFAPGKVERFAIDGYALLGVAVGCKFLSGRISSVDWFLQLLEKSIDALSSDAWQLSLVRAAKSLLLNDVIDTNCDSVLRVSLSRSLGIEVSSDDRQDAWHAMLSQLEEQDFARRATFHGVFEGCASALARLPVYGAGREELVEVLEGVSNSMSHWTYETDRRVKNVDVEKWNVRHEYHVQNLLWTILRPIFPDIVDEESLKKIGHTTPRADLGIPSLSTVIEVKFLRKRGQAQLKKITDEIAADRTLYLHKGTGYTSMIAFIWDDCRQTEEYKTLCDGLESIEGIEKIIVLPRPARMEEP